jgi:putative methyltransferase
LAENSGQSTKRTRGGEASINSDGAATLNVDLDDTTAEETPFDGKLIERIATLSRFQLHILTHAMRFPSARKITYSTCSIHFEENEGVVFQALASSVAKKHGWAILRKDAQVHGLRGWERRGVWEDNKISIDVEEGVKDEVLQACIRCDKGTSEGTMGFFVAAFVRNTPPASTGAVDVFDRDEDEWNGFSDSDDQETQKAT